MCLIHRCNLCVFFPDLVQLSGKYGKLGLYCIIKQVI